MGLQAHLGVVAGWLRRIYRSPDERNAEDLASIHEKTATLMALLERNNEVLRTVADMEEKSQGEHLFDLNYVRASLDQVRGGVREIAEHMITLGGPSYEVLRQRVDTIDAELMGIIEGTPDAEDGPYVIPFDRLDHTAAAQVGAKSAHLGAMRSSLGLPVPEGFAISLAAYRRFIAANDLQSRISERIHAADIRSLDDLSEVSASIAALVAASEVPDDLAEAIRASARDLVERSGARRFSLRSSAIAEDSIVSFAGQYRTLLNVGEEEILDRYRDVLAATFTRRAIYYFLSHQLSDSALAMGVACMAMVDATASGVVYTRDPIRPDRDEILVSSIWGLGQYLVDGTLTPDVFRISRRDHGVLDRQIARKPARLVMQPTGGVGEEPVPPGMQEAPSITDQRLAQLASLSERIERHYGAPQDIEWAIDREGAVLLLQTRPLRVLRPSAPATQIDVSQRPTLRCSGVTVCPGAGAGPIQHVRSRRDLGQVREGVVLVSPRPFPTLVTVLSKISALVTEVGGVASHLATLAREYRVPTLAGIGKADDLPEGEIVTVDASHRCIYSGEHADLVAARRPEYELFEDTAIFDLLRRLLAKISPLNLLHPHDEGFRAESCQTFHDVTRFAHQRAMEEMFANTQKIGRGSGLALRVRTSIPLEIYLIHMEEGAARSTQRGWIDESKFGSIPMTALWEGIREQGWPSRGRPMNLRGFASVVATQMSASTPVEFCEPSFALVGREYMLLSLSLGYHFTTIEAMCTAEPSRNYVRMQLKGGGASLDRRLRRVRLLREILTILDFDISISGDCLDSVLAYETTATLTEKLRLLGRLTMVTKQLDMVLANDGVTDWYVDDIKRRLGLTAPPSTAS